MRLTAITLLLCACVWLSAGDVAHLKAKARLLGRLAGKHHKRGVLSSIPTFKLGHDIPRVTHSVVKPLVVNYPPTASVTAVKVPLSHPLLPHYPVPVGHKVPVPHPHYGLKFPHHTKSVVLPNPDHHYHHHHHHVEPRPVVPVVPAAPVPATPVVPIAAPTASFAHPIPAPAPPVVFRQPAPPPLHILPPNHLHLKPGLPAAPSPFLSGFPYAAQFPYVLRPGGAVQSSLFATYPRYPLPYPSPFIPLGASAFSQVVPHQYLVPQGDAHDGVVIEPPGQVHVQPTPTLLHAHGEVPQPAVHLEPVQPGVHLQPAHPDVHFHAAQPGIHLQPEHPDIHLQSLQPGVHLQPGVQVHGQPDIHLQPSQPGFNLQPVQPEFHLQPGHTDFHVQPGHTDIHVQPGHTDVHLQPVQPEFHLQPGHTDFHVQQGHTDVYLQPGHTDVHLQPGQIDVHQQAAHPDFHLQPGQYDVHQQGGQATFHYQPGQTDVNQQPAHPDFHFQPQPEYHLQPNQPGILQPTQPTVDSNGWSPVPAQPNDVAHNEGQYQNDGHHHFTQEQGNQVFEHHTGNDQYDYQSQIHHHIQQQIEQAQYEQNLNNQHQLNQEYGVPQQFGQSGQDYNQNDYNLPQQQPGQEYGVPQQGAEGRSAEGDAEGEGDPQLYHNHIPLGLQPPIDRPLDLFR